MFQCCMIFLLICCLLPRAAVREEKKVLGRLLFRIRFDKMVIPVTCSAWFSSSMTWPSIVWRCWWTTGDLMLSERTLYGRMDLMMEEMVGLDRVSTELDSEECFRVWYLMDSPTFLVAHPTLNSMVTSLVEDIDWVVDDGDLVPANRWGQVLRQSRRGPTKEQHVHWVLVDADELKEGPEVNKS